MVERPISVRHVVRLMLTISIVFFSTIQTSQSVIHILQWLQIEKLVPLNIFCAKNAGRIVEKSSPMFGTFLDVLYPHILPRQFVT